MNKKLLITLLPLAFFVAACSGAREGIQSTSVPPATTSTPAGGDTTSEPAGEDTSSEAPVDERGKAALSGEGYEVLVGTLYYDLTEQEADTGRVASYNIKDLSLDEGQKVSVYKDGEKVSIWAEADKANGVYPNYDERPQESQYDEFTITESAIGDIYFHENQGGSYSIWITPSQSEGGSSEGGEGGGSSAPEGAPETGMAIVVNGTAFYSLVDEGAWDMDPTFNQYSYTEGLELAEGDIISFYNADAEGGPATWGVMNIDPASQGSLTQEADGLKVGVAGTYDIYIKMKFAQDNIYIGPHQA